MKLDLAEIRARAERATEGPWRVVPWKGSRVHDRVTSWCLHVVNDQDGISREDTWGEIYGPHMDDYEHEGEMKANALLIAHARTDIPNLCNRVEELEAAIEPLLAQWEAFQTCQDGFPGNQEQAYYMLYRHHVAKWEALRAALDGKDT